MRALVNCEVQRADAVTELGLGSGPADASTWKVNYAYGELDANGNVDAAKNTGNIAKQTLSFAGLANPIVQAFKYDSLYRLTEAKETSTSTTPDWVQNFGYDRYGNRLTFSQNIAGNTTATNPAVDPNTNRFTNLTDFGYDKNGNITRDLAPSNQSRTFIFNADNKQTEVKDANGVSVGKYYYDGEGKRVKKVTDTETTIFVYSSGKLVAEYSTQLSQNPSISYTTTDHLGSPRIITDQLGQVKSRRDFMPFGEDLFNGVGARSSALQYGSNTDDIKQKFTGYLKDNETNLDFAEARMYENRYARFTAVDPLLASGKSANPQTFNRYIYVGNNLYEELIQTEKTGGTL
jgi:RHS repeat-associated protein